MSVEELGITLVTGVVNESTLKALRAEVDRISEEAGSACVRQLLGRSAILQSWLKEMMLSELLPRGERVVKPLRAVRSILFNKTAEENWPVAWHQDLTIAVDRKVEVDGYGPWSEKSGVVHVQPPSEVLESIVTLRLHLDDTPEENGALWCVPKSHSTGRLPHAQVSEVVKQSEPQCYSCLAGDVLLMKPLTLHASKRAVNPAQRRVIHVEFAPEEVLDSRLQWNESAVQ